MPQRALASVNLAAIERNVSRLCSGLSAGTALCAVVKADGYGHGALPAARAALAGGASMLAVATALEAADLRARKINARILVLGAISREELPIALRTGAEIVVWNERFVETLLVTRAAAGDSPRAPTGIHVKLDSGLGRLGTRDRSEALAVAERVAAARGALTLTGAMTHFATADEELEFMRLQLERFERFLAELRARHPRLIAHAANSAATLREPASHFDMVRCGIAIYGGDPMNEDPDHHALEPAMELSSYVAAVKLARAGDSTGYGRRFIADRDTWIATLPIGYGDGLRRALTNNCDVLIGGRRYPLVGAVSMDNVTVDLGAAPAASVGERAIIIGRDGGIRQTAEDLARRIATINYEILCGVSSRVPRSYHHDGQPAS